MAYRILIDSATLAKNLDDSDCRIFDVRHDLANPALGRQQYTEGHIPGASFVDLDRELSGEKTGANGRHPLPLASDFMATLGEWGIRPAQQIVLYDASGGTYAGRLWWMLRWMGHYSVALLDGGFPKWEKEGRPVTAEVPHYAPSAYRGAPRAMHVDAAFVSANLGKSEVTVIDARAAGRFAGIGETIDPVGGHIPGALNRPFGENLGKDGCFKAPQVLAKEFAQLLGNRSPKQIVHQCGSGVSACHNILAMEIAGLAGSRLYPGSWSEWCSDPDRPVATGPG
ncbi:MAG: sulfurtransferase [Betaproteobacteria bacterium]|nr:sulfurtransferase [Betaproteobacteria bacterium]